MKISEVINESPQIIPSLDTYDTEDVRKLCLMSYQNKTAKFIESLSDTASLYHIGNNDNGVYFSELNNAIGYFAKYTKVEMHPSLIKHLYGVRQILINSYPHMGPAKTGVGKHIFWNYLYPIHKTLISDSQQTENGRSFWEYRIVEALEKNIPVFMINTDNRSKIEITSFDDIPKMEKNIWGVQNWFRRIVLVIGET